MRPSPNDEMLHSRVVMLDYDGTEKWSLTSNETGSNAFAVMPTMTEGVGILWNNVATTPTLRWVNLSTGDITSPGASFADLIMDIQVATEKYAVVVFKSSQDELITSLVDLEDNFTVIPLTGGSYNNAPAPLEFNRIDVYSMASGDILVAYSTVTSPSPGPPTLTVDLIRTQERAIEDIAGTDDVFPVEVLFQVDGANNRVYMTERWGSALYVDMVDVTKTPAAWFTPIYDQYFVGPIVAPILSSYHNGLFLFRSGSSGLRGSFIDGDTGLATDVEVPANVVDFLVDITDGGTGVPVVDRMNDVMGEIRMMTEVPQAGGG